MAPFLKGKLFRNNGYKVVNGTEVEKVFRSTAVTADA